MASGQGCAVLAVASADHAHHRDIAAQAVAQHGFVTGGNACVGQLQVAQGVVLVHIDTGVIQHQVGLIKRQQVVEGVVHHLQVGSVAHASGQGNVPVALCLAGGEVLLAVQRHGDGLGRVVQDARGAVTLVHIAVEDQHPVYPACFQQVAADDRQVVENAERMTSLYL